MRIPLSVLVFAACLSGCAATSTRFEFGVIGDAPYTAKEEEKFPRVIAAMNAADLAFVVHVGDLQDDPRSYRSGGPPCTDSTLVQRKAMLDASKHPLILTPGDNDWSDCRFAKPPIDPYVRLDAVRKIFHSPDRVLGSRALDVERQSNDPAFAKYVENLRWVHRGVLFATIHTVGFNNNRGYDAAGDAEYAARNAANLAWIRAAFERATRERHKAVVIFTQANPSFDDEWPPFLRRFFRVAEPIDIDAGGAIVPRNGPSGFHDILVEFASEAAQFARPVLFVHGDTHYFRVDRPVWDPFGDRHVENAIRVESFGSPAVHWIRIAVDPDDPNVFDIKPELVNP
jgi:hypothetical protein